MYSNIATYLRTNAEQTVATTSFKKYMSKHPITGNGATVDSVESFLKFQWRIPLYQNDALYPTTNVKRSNKYLRYQNRRISSLIRNKKYWEALQCFRWMLKTSKSFKVYALNRWYSGWYQNQSFIQVRRTYRLLDQKFRELPLQFGLTRIYIPKKNGKLRPLGIPNVSDRILNSAWASFIAAMFDEERLTQNQHAYRKGRGVHTAWQQIIELTKQHPEYKIYECDFKSFFNTINPLAVRNSLARYNCSIENYVEAVNLAAIPKMEKLQEEKEFIRRTSNSVTKNGLPQGMPWSPVLAMTVLDRVKFDEWLAVLFADDLILFLKEGQTIDDFLQGNSLFKFSGIQFAPEKCGWVEKNLKFLGTTMNLETRELTNDQGTIQADETNLDKLSKFVGKTYTKEVPKDWKWNVNNKSWLALHHPVMNGNTLIQYIWKLGLLLISELIEEILGINVRRKPILKWLGLGTDIRRFKWTIYSVGQVSTQACSYMLKKVKATDPLISTNKGKIKKRRKVKRQVPFEELEPQYSSPMNPASMDLGNEFAELVTIPGYNPSYQLSTNKTKNPFDEQLWKETEERFRKYLQEGGISHSYGNVFYNYRR